MADLKNGFADVTPAPQCVLLFSGGRDSTLSAIRLVESGSIPILVTVKSDHLEGIHRVQKRLRELRAHLPGKTRWLLIRQPPPLPGTPAVSSSTCLPCQRAYIMVGARIAEISGCKSLALGYAGYQSSWVEQTPEAVERLKQALADHGLDLALPVYSIPSKEEAISELKKHGLTSNALEQKCLKQQFNRKLGQGEYEAELVAWENGIRHQLGRKTEFKLDLVQDIRLADLTG